MKRYNSIGKDEILAANKVVRSGILSEYIAKPGKYFLGGKNVFVTVIIRFKSNKYYCMVLWFLTSIKHANLK